MRWGLLWAAAAAAMWVAGCGRLGLGPPPAKSSPSQPAAAALDLKPYSGASYGDFLSEPGMERFAPEALGLPESDVARFHAIMAAATTAEWISGGGAEALVFSSCAPAGCEAGVAVLAIDAASGAPFMALRDGEGADVLAPNARVEALLTLTSPTRRWDDVRPGGRED